MNQQIPAESFDKSFEDARGALGRSTGGIVNAVTKAGSNDVRGSLFYLYRPEQLARGNKYSDAVQEQRLNALGLGGERSVVRPRAGGAVGDDGDAGESRLLVGLQVEAVLVEAIASETGAEGEVRCYAAIGRADDR